MLTQNLPELFARCAESFIPTRLEDFIGRQITDKGSGAHAVATQIQRSLALADAHGRQAQKYLFPGEPGVGKSLMVKWIQHLTGCSKWNTTKLNGTQVKIEKTDEIASQLAYSNLFGEWRMVWIDEADAIPNVAQVRFLTLLDDLPAGVIVCCTSNLTLRAFENRFQSRFEAFQILAPTAEEIVELLQRFTPNDPDVVNIARFARGNVRQALLELKGLVGGAESLNPLFAQAA